MAEPAQIWSAADYARNAGFVPALGGPVVDLLDPRPGERILDLGCGDGVLTAEIAARGATVVGLDSSPELLAAARGRGLDVRLGDGERLEFVARFDAVFSNAALHWMCDQEAVVAGVRRALVPGGRFVGEFGGHGNVAAIVTGLIAALSQHGIDGAARMPWVFPTAAEFAALLVGQGFEVATIALVPRPTPLPTGLVGWLGSFANPFLGGLDAAERAEALATVEALTAPSLRDRSGNWTADYVRLRFAAKRID
jgi:trans-aconitate methyltransferase